MPKRYYYISVCKLDAADKDEAGKLAIVIAKNKLKNSVLNSDWEAIRLSETPKFHHFRVTRQDTVDTVTIPVKV